MAEPKIPPDYRHMIDMDDYPDAEPTTKSYAEDLAEAALATFSEENSVGNLTVHTDAIRGFKAGAAWERKRTVAWLRNHAPLFTDPYALADLIEREAGGGP